MDKRWFCARAARVLLTLCALGGLMTAGAFAAEESQTVSGGTRYVYTLDADGIDSGESYLIVSAKDGEASAFTNLNGSAGGTDVTVSDGTIVLTDNTNVGWTITQRSTNTICLENGGYYIQPGNSGLLTTNKEYLTFRNEGSGEYKIYSEDYYRITYDKKWKRLKEKGSVYLYVLTDVISLPVCAADTLVLDYGLPVDIPVLSNDTLDDSCTLAGIGRVEDIPEAGYTQSLAEGFTAQTRTLEHGFATLHEGRVRYTPDERFMCLASGESFAYALASSGGYVYGTVTVFPATSVCYEEDFLTFAAYSRDDVMTADTWPLAGTPLERTQTAGGGPYGYDAAYLDMPGFSMGAARTAHVSKDGYAEAEFSFTGTGFDLIGLTGNTTGAVTADIYQGGEWIRTILVDSFYASRAPDALYQTPLMHVIGLDYDSYDVVVTAAYSESFDHGQYADGGYDIYLDAVRIYGQAGGEAAQSAYLADGEGWPEYIELRELLLDAGSFGTEDGGVFIDGLESAALSDYAAYGPKNEVYLAAGQSVVFHLNLETGTFSAVRLGLKSLGGSTSCRIFTAQGGEKGAVALDTAADLSYDITALADQTVIVLNTGDAPLSLTNIRITYPAAPEER